MTTASLEGELESGEKILELLECGEEPRAPIERKWVSVDLPVFMVDSLDGEAQRLGVSRRLLIKLWLADRLGRVEKG